MGLKIWLLLGSLCGLVAGLLLDAVVPVPPAYLRAVQLGLVAFGAIVAAFIYDGARLMAGGREPTRSTDRPRRRRPFRYAPRRTRA